ncbi:hypothetical protein DID88_007637 [Monilinia fructigena]|uniref:Uncharacterized protein n=1 Tax=Monilinia fructigena TaxID=38457 RepID=A0A395J2X0_9HELO|nr:hypothetical protein DID88_007637 [Monilinia fructigena]
MHHHLLFTFVAPAVLAVPSTLKSRGDCRQGYTLCSPASATTANTPQIGDSDFANLFQDIVLSSLPASKRSLSPPSEANDSYGTVVGGSYTSSSGATANLETGDYTSKDGTTGNIYSGNEAAKPSTATLPMPSQFTASGVGSAIPASVLGGVTITYTTTLPASTIPATTIPAITISESVSTQTIPVPTTITTEIEGSRVVSTEVEVETGLTTIPETTRSKSTRSASTVSESVVTVTTVVQTGASVLSGAASATATATGKSGGGKVEVGVSGLVGMLGVMALVF